MKGFYLQFDLDIAAFLYIRGDRIIAASHPIYPRFFRGRQPTQVERLDCLPDQRIGLSIGANIAIKTWLSRAYCQPQFVAPSELGHWPDQAANAFTSLGYHIGSNMRPQSITGSEDAGGNKSYQEARAPLNAVSLFRCHPRDCQVPRTSKSRF